MFNVMAIGSVVASLLASPVSTPVDTPAEAPLADKVSIQAVTINGSGCPAGSASVVPSRDGRSLVVTYDGYFAWRGGGAGATDFRRNCQISLRVQGPEGYTYTIAGADYHGFAYLPDGATALQGANYYFQGNSATTQSRHTFEGPLYTQWRATDTADDLESLGYAPCDGGRNLNINTELRVSPGSADAEATAFITMDSSVVYRLAWKRC